MQGYRWSKAKGPLAFVAVLIAFGFGAATRAGCNEWTTNGPYGGSIGAVAVDPFVPGTVYAAGQGADYHLNGFFRSTDGGANWIDLSGGEPVQFEMLLPDPFSPGHLYGVPSGAHSVLSKSVDGGHTWAFLGYGGCLALDPTTPGKLYTGGWKSLRTSTDGGATWTELPHWDGASVTALAVAPGAPSTLYAIVEFSEPARTAVFKSADGGISWAQASQGLPEWGLDSLVADPSCPETVYAGVFWSALSPYGIFKTENGGASWFLANNGIFHEGHEGAPALVLDPRTPSTIYAASAYFDPKGGDRHGRLYKSTDGAATWAALPDDPSEFRHDIFSLALDPLAPETLYSATDGGIFKSADGGSTWAFANRGISRLGIQQVAAENLPGGALYAATEGAGIQKSLDGGLTWKPANHGITDRWVSALVLDPLNPSTLYCGTSLAGAFKSTDAGETWTAINEGLPIFFGYFIGVYDLAINPVNPQILYANSDPVYKTVDGGASWSPASEGFPEPAALRGPLLLDPASPDTLYAPIVYQQSDRDLFKTVDGGASWSSSSQGIPWPHIVYGLAMDPQDSATLYAGTNGDGVFKTTDGGNSWWRLEGCPDYTARALAADPGRPGTFYASMTWWEDETGNHEAVYRTEDDGITWTLTQEGLSRFSNLAGDSGVPETLYASTPRGVYAMTRVPVPGDCGGDGEVSIGEVQRALNMFVWGTTPACNVDADGDGQVTIGEVQRVINGFLGTSNPCEG